VRVDRWHRGGRTVTLIGMVHVGKPATYRRVRSAVLAMERAGAQVQYEGVRRLGEGAELTDAERDLAERLKGGLSELYEYFAASGLALQSRHLRPEPSWVNADVDIVQLIRAMDDPEGFVRMFEEFREMRQEFPGTARVLSTVLIKTMVTRRWVRTLVARRSRMSEQSAIGALRDASAVTAILAATTDVVALWGEAHLDGIGEGLRAAGFERVR
jgi:hypothetical protein